jgi:hypothetical protein
MNDEKKLSRTALELLHPSAFILHPSKVESRAGIAPAFAVLQAAA